jgi:hypothetical protein
VLGWRWGRRHCGTKEESGVALTTARCVHGARVSRAAAAGPMRAGVHSGVWALASCGEVSGARGSCQSGARGLRRVLASVRMTEMRHDRWRCSGGWLRRRS